METATASAVVFGRESFDVFWPECQSLLQKHFAEIASFPDIPLEPDRQWYEGVEARGSLRIFAARLQGRVMPRIEPLLVGYAVFFVNPNPHYRTSMQAVADVIYLDPEFRKGGTGKQLLQFAERELAGEGVEVVYHHVKIKHPALGVLLERMGYEPIDTIYSRRLA